MTPMTPMLFAGALAFARLPACLPACPQHGSIGSAAGADEFLPLLILTVIRVSQLWSRPRALPTATANPQPLLARLLVPACLRMIYHC